MTTLLDKNEETGVREKPPPQIQFPLWSLLALTLAGFLTILTEALPAGLLPQIGASLQVGSSLAGQLVTVYALGSLLAAIPLATATQKLRRKPLLLVTVAAFAVVNFLTAVSSNIILTLALRFVAGIAAGLLWAMLGGYATRMVAVHLHGRAITVALAGTPVALSIGIPAGTYLGIHFGWRYAFIAMSMGSLLAALWVWLRVPDFPGQTSATEASPLKVMRHPGVGAVLAATFAFVLAHNMLYTYIAPFLGTLGLLKSVDRILLTFGIAGVIGVLLVGSFIDRHLRSLMIVTVASFGLAALALGLAGQHTAITYVAVAVWGFAFAGAGTIVTATTARAAGPYTDLAQSLLVTDWNLAITGGGIFGGVLVGMGQVHMMPWLLVVLLVISLAVVLRAKQGFRQ